VRSLSWPVGALRRSISIREVFRDWAADANVEIIDAARVGKKEAEIVFKNVLNTVLNVPTLSPLVRRRLTLSEWFIFLTFKIVFGSLI